MIWFLIIVVACAGFWFPRTFSAIAAAIVGFSLGGVAFSVCLWYELVPLIAIVPFLLLGTVMGEVIVLRMLR